MTIAALYVEKGGVYASFDDVELWDVERDARRYAGPHPVVAHPPCKTWSLMSNCRPEIERGADDGTFEAALHAVRTWGGVLEHPAHSLAWARYELPRPPAHGWASSLFDQGWACEVDQAWYGHRANKRTWLYYVGASQPEVIHGRAPATGLRVHDDGGGGRDQRSRTPRAFAEALLELARHSNEKGEAMQADEQLRLWSVTTLIKLGLGTSDPLVNWAVRTTAEAAIKSRRTIEQMLGDEGEEAAIAWLKDARYRQTKKAQLRGSVLHAAAEQLALGARPIDVDALVMPYVEQYARWLKTWAPRFVLAEAPVYNPSYLYAGTLDGIVELDGRATLFDIKTTPYGPNEDRSRPPYPEVALQLAAYAHATHVGVLSEQRYDDRRRRYYIFDSNAQHEPMPAVERAICVVVSPFDCFAVPVRIDDSVWHAFLHVRECARWQLAGSRDLFGPPIIAQRGEAVA